jgi:hypothetical protein
VPRRTLVGCPISVQPHRQGVFAILIRQEFQALSEFSRN